MRQLSTPALLLVAALATGCDQDTPISPTATHTPEPAALSARSAANCQNVQGAIEGNFAVPGGFTLQGLGTAEVTVVGLDAKGARGQGAIHSVVLHRITTAGGTIMTSDEGVLAPVDPPLYRLNHRWTITGGTGDFEGASGFLRPHALINLATGEIGGSFHGRICT
jgi:hypothetical protein